MRRFEDIYAIAAERHPDIGARLTAPPAPKELAKIPDDRWLAAMTRAVFQAGFNWKVVEAMWPGFEEAFWGFDPGRVALMSDDDIEEKIKDTRVIRYAAKIISTQTNAAFITELAREHGSAGQAFAAWPPADFTGLLEMMKKKASRMGGTTGQYFLRSMGVDSFILSRDVIGRLVAEGVIEKAPTSKAAVAKVQEAFNTWSAQSGRSLTEISRTLALSTG